LTKRERIAWLRQHSKLVLPEFHTKFGPDPRYLPERYTDYNQDLKIQFWVGPLADKWDWVAWYHEAIHVADFDWWTPEIRELAKPILGGPDRPWFWDRDPRVESKLPDPYCEALANQLARVCIGWVTMPQLTALYLRAYNRR
jgi:hypothetical protein